MRPEKCGSCGKAGLWHVSPMLDYTVFGDTVEAGAPGGIAPLETYVCEPCGYTEWFTQHRVARGTPIRGGRWVAPEEGACPSCKSTALCFIRMLDLDASDKPAPWPQSAIGGELLCVLCADCGRLDWYATKDVGGSPSARCERCGSDTAESGAVEHAGVGLQRYPVARIDGREIGDFQLRVCSGCAHVDWFATGVDRPIADGNCRIERVSVERADKIGPGGGPYR